MNNSAYVNLQEKAGIGPLNAACHKEHHGTVQLFLNNGADVNLFEETVISPLYVACYKGY